MKSQTETLRSGHRKIYVIVCSLLLISCTGGFRSSSPSLGFASSAEIPRGPSDLPSPGTNPAPSNPGNGSPPGQPPSGGSSNAPATLYPLPAGPLKYFGYWGGVLDGLASIQEQRDHVNFTYVTGGSAHTVQVAAAAGLRSIIAVPGANDSSWDQWANEVAPQLPNILAFLLEDEPDCQRSGQGNQMYNNVIVLGQRIRARFPGAKTIITLGCVFVDGPAVVPSIPLPTVVDYVAVETYGFGYSANQRAQYQVIANYIGNRGIFMMPGGIEWFGTDAVLAESARVLYEYAKTDSRVIGLFPFMWYSEKYNTSDNSPPKQPNGPEAPIGNKGVRDLPNLRARLTEIGKEIIQGRVPAASSSEISIPPSQNPSTGQVTTGLLRICYTYGGMPVAGVNLQSGSVTATTGNNGCYETTVAFGDYSVVATHSSVPGWRDTNTIHHFSNPTILNRNF